MTSIPTIETPHLLLRPLQETDLEEVMAMGADPDVMRFIGSGQTQTRDEAAALLVSPSEFDRARNPDTSLRKAA